MYMQEWSLMPTSYHRQKINSKWIKELNVRAKNVELRRKHSGNSLVILDLPRFLKFDTKSISNQKKRQVKLHQNWNLLYFGGYHKELEETTAEWEKMCGNYIPNKGLASRIHKEPLEWNNKMINNTKHKGSE